MYLLKLKGHFGCILLARTCAAFQKEPTDLFCTLFILRQADRFMMKQPVCEVVRPALTALVMRGLSPVKRSSVPEQGVKPPRASLAFLLQTPLYLFSTWLSCADNLRVLFPSEYVVYSYVRFSFTRSVVFYTGVLSLSVGPSYCHYSVFFHYNLPGLCTQVLLVCCIYILHWGSQWVIILHGNLLELDSQYNVSHTESLVCTLKHLKY